MRNTTTGVPSPAGWGLARYKTDKYDTSLHRPVRCWQENSVGKWGHESNDRETAFKAALVRVPDVPGEFTLKHEDWDYVYVVRRRSYRKYWSGNDGSQGWRHRETGYTIPDFCRLTGGCPDMWHRTRRRQLTVREDSPILNYLVSHE